MENKNKIILITMIFFSLIILSGTSYALLKTSYRGNNTYTMNIGNLEISFQDNNTNSLTLTNMYPMTDEEGIVKPYYSETYLNSNDVIITYNYETGHFLE